MIRLLVVLLAALYTIMNVYGDPARRPEVARAEPLGLNLIQASYSTDEAIMTERLPLSNISDDEAVKIALDAGVEFRSERKRGPLLGNAIAAKASVAATETVATEASTTKSYWYVTGGRVNLRKGPGTGNAVVGTVTLGVEAEVLGDQNGWYQIRTSDGASTGWIYGKFLGEKRPG